MRPRGGVPRLNLGRVYRTESDWRECQYGDSGFQRELIEQIAALWQMMVASTSNAARAPVGVGPAEQCQACGGEFEAVEDLTDEFRSTGCLRRGTEQSASYSAHGHPAAPGADPADIDPRCRGVGA